MPLHKPVTPLPPANCVWPEAVQRIKKLTLTLISNTSYRYYNITAVKGDLEVGQS